ncbi:MAG: phenylalanine--tRNA ligase subunit beta [Gemmatimonadaceae bacterium]
MNASCEWLQSLLPVVLSPEAMRDLITARCCTVDELVHLRDDLRDVVVGVVVEASRHPESDHLWVTKVDAGRGELLDVVCGAPNVQVGERYPFAPAGSTLPGGVKLEKRKIRGAISNGMLCSARELGLGSEHDGILRLDTQATAGTSFLQAMGAGDARLVIDVTPNRPDLLSHVGLARELAAATGSSLTIPPVAGADAVRIPAVAVAPREAHAGAVRVALEDIEGCLRYDGVVIRGLSVRPSPRWLADRLVAVGSRPINNVVDITNYLLYELGQPMHAFDARKLAGPAVIIRRAHDGETLTTLDGVERTLSSSMTVIADQDRAQAIAGVMGGRTAEVTDDTTDIFLEVANFHPSSVRRARRTLAMSTDASYRFERGVDFELPPRALARAVEMLLTVAGGHIDGAPVDLRPSPRPLTRIALRVARVERVLGIAFTADAITTLLRSIGFAVERGAEKLDVTVPSWRPDVAQEVDLIEEVARLHGYDAFPAEIRPFRPGTVPDSPAELVSRRVRELLVARGLLEARAMPFVSGAPRGFARVANPLAENEAYLRREVLDTLARRAEYNLSRMHRDIRLFEIGAAFIPVGEPLPREELRAAALMTGRRHPPHWTDTHSADFDQWDAKALAEELAGVACPDASIELAAGDGDALWTIIVNGVECGAVRRVELDAPVWAAPVYGLEMTLMRVESAPVAPPGHSAVSRERPAAVPARPSLRYRPLPITPAVELDIALLVPNELPAATVEQVIRGSAGELLESLSLFDEYRGDGVPAGVRSLAWRLTFRHPTRTLRDKEIAGRRDKLLRTLEGELGVRQRTT